MPAYFFLFQHIVFYYYLCFVRIPLGELILVAAEIAFHGDGDARKAYDWRRLPPRIQNRKRRRSGYLVGDILRIIPGIKHAGPIGIVAQQIDLTRLEMGNVARIELSGNQIPAQMGFIGHARSKAQYSTPPSQPGVRETASHSSAKSTRPTESEIEEACGRWFNRRCFFTAHPPFYIYFCRNIYFLIHPLILQ